MNRDEASMARLMAAKANRSGTDENPDAESVFPESPEPILRPTGEGAISIGGWAFALGVMCLIGSFFIETSRYGEINYGAINWRWNLMLFGAGLAQLGTLVWLAGYIVRAIFFLPGKDDDAQN
jgi:choline-glycine betaine transporter